MDIEEFFKINNNVALAFSGGTDSAYLLYAALKYAGRVKAYYVKSPFQPDFETEDARRLAANLGADMKIIGTDVLCDENIRKNPAGRCYYCKKRIFGEIIKAAAADGFDVVIDGTNASDDEGDRPGMRALRELKVKSPLRECGITKNEIRSLSEEAGLFTYNKPAYACLATRIPTGEEITAEKLKKAGEAENFMFSLGFEDFRVRLRNNNALIQVKKSQFEKAEEQMPLIEAELLKYCSSVALDTEVMR